MVDLKFSVPTPNIDAMIIICGASHVESFYKDTKYNLGICHMLKEGSKKYLYEGIDTPQA